MASGKMDTHRTEVLNWGLRGAAANQPGTSQKVLLTSTGTTASAIGTQITGTGYTANGTNIDFGAASGNAATGDAAVAIEWTNGSGSSWTIDGAVLHDSAGAPAASEGLYFINALGLTVPDGVLLRIPVNGMTITET